MKRKRLRDLGITVGDLPVGSRNAITDVPGVAVGHATIIHDQPRVARTGVTVIVPEAVSAFKNGLFAGYHSFNGCGEMTGTLWIEDCGMLTTPIALTNTHQAGLVRDTLALFAAEKCGLETFALPVVAETYDGWLNDMNAFHVKPEHVYQALTVASTGAVAEGNIGGGTGMICHEFKGGIGTSSRVVECCGGPYTVGILVQANYGRRDQLRVNGRAVGKQITPDTTPLPWAVRTPRNAPAEPPSGSIIVIIATDAPLLPHQCKRLAQRATVGLARVGGVGYNTSGDLFLAFSTAAAVPLGKLQLNRAEFLAEDALDFFFNAVAEGVEESILNALCGAETMTGFSGHTAHALPYDMLVSALGSLRE